MWVLLSLDAPHCLERWVLHGMLTIAQVPHTKRNIMRLEDSITQSSVSILDITIPVGWLSVNFTNTYSPLLSHLVLFDVLFPVSWTIVW